MSLETALGIEILTTFMSIHWQFLRLSPQAPVRLPVPSEPWTSLPCSDPPAHPSPSPSSPSPAERSCPAGATSSLVRVHTFRLLSGPPNCRAGVTSPLALPRLPSKSPLPPLRRGQASRSDPSPHPGARHRLPSPLPASPPRPAEPGLPLPASQPRPGEPAQPHPSTRRSFPSPLPASPPRPGEPG